MLQIGKTHLIDPTDLNYIGMTDKLISLHGTYSEWNLILGFKNNPQHIYIPFSTIEEAQAEFDKLKSHVPN